jgi:hypothetical protein
MDSVRPKEAFDVWLKNLTSRWILTTPPSQVNEAGVRVTHHRLYRRDEAAKAIALLERRHTEPDRTAIHIVLPGSTARGRARAA